MNAPGPSPRTLLRKSRGGGSGTVIVLYPFIHWGEVGAILLVCACAQLLSMLLEIPGRRAAERESIELNAQVLERDAQIIRRGY